MHDWPTKTKDLLITKIYIERYASSLGLKNSIGIFEVTTNLEKKCFEVKLSPWVMAITHHFEKQYGCEQGQIIARKVITLCLTQDQTIH
jgi:hypothetical protein